ncbi:NADH-quinone oxidoreductase subunit NuoG [Orrella daihaiensis]|uniref:NADH-quinone oxidoreductase n=1 Tax=Orrella daihaiensis TaxID=2782176 RepID=A0ABY4AL80_9BURK|nr:NADH-quinone oxidoreductase subunit NuoG [Orrella daihaiensis]UOD51043.1 NADH-quinone oxidoreductase subunit G [Orrella daihaiensis]
MVELTIDGKNVEVPEGSMVMHAAHKLGIYVPHFCYHKKLSIAANCRMCLVEVEKAPKALPACATPATNGMIVHTCSEKAIAAQKSVMEFLLINHPLDCPICDQGGECQLQDLAVGYGGSASRYEEEKRVVFHKDLGPLVSAEEMSRCIHCTRCVRFGQEIAGVMELGMLNRGEHSEITTFVGRSIESELSGNMIDICPVGALTSKPFRYSARTWELARRKSVSPHDSLGANLVVQVKRDEVMRIVPFENESINECWISDRDRFAYEGLREDRLESPMIKGDDGVWREASWADALQAVAQGLSNVRESMGASQIGFIGSEQCTLEELSLLSRVAHGVGSPNVDARARLTDPNWDAALEGVPSLGMPIAELGELDRVLVVGAFMRADHPLMTQRLRQAAKRGTQVSSIDLAADDPLLSLHGRMTVAPAAMSQALAEVAVALANTKGIEVPAAFAGVIASEQASRIAQSLASGQNVAVLIGNAAAHAANASQLAANARWIAEQSNGKFGFLTAGANTVGAYLANAVPAQGGKMVNQMLEHPLAAYVVVNLEPKFDTALGQVAVDNLRASKFAVALTPYQSAAQDWAHVMLPIGPYTETSGTFVNAEGTPQSFKATVPPHAQSRPGWKVLRVLGNLLKLPEFDEESSEAVRDAVLTGGIASKLSNQIKTPVGLSKTASNDGLQRIADVAIYRSDAIVRRAHALQQTKASEPPVARVHPDTLACLGITDCADVKLRSTTGESMVVVRADASVAMDCVRLPVGFESSAALGSVQSALQVERA